MRRSIAFLLFIFIIMSHYPCIKPLFFSQIAGTELISCIYMKTPGQSLEVGLQSLSYLSVAWFWEAVWSKLINNFSSILFVYLKAVFYCVYSDWQLIIFSLLLCLTFFSSESDMWNFHGLCFWETMFTNASVTLIHWTFVFKGLKMISKRSF